MMARLGIFTFFFVSLLQILFAAPVGDPSFPKAIEKGFLIPQECWASLRLGYEGDFVYDGRMRQHVGGQRVDNYRQISNGASFTLSLLERLDLYSVLSLSETKAEWRFVNGPFIQNANFRTNLDLLWRLGFRALLFSIEGFSLGIGGKYSSSHYGFSTFRVDGQQLPLEGTALQWNAWQVYLATSYKIDLFTPYIGVKCSRARAKLGNFSIPISQSGLGINRFENRMKVGMFLGFTFSTKDYFFLNLEGRLVDEEAATIAFQFKF